MSLAWKGLVAAAVLGGLAILWHGFLIDHRYVTARVFGTKVWIDECTYLGLTGRFLRLPHGDPSAPHPICPGE